MAAVLSDARRPVVARETKVSLVGVLRVVFLPSFRAAAVTDDKIKSADLKIRARESTIDGRKIKEHSYMSARRFRKRKTPTFFSYTHVFLNLREDGSRSSIKYLYGREFMTRFFVRDTSVDILFRLCYREYR